MTDVNADNRALEGPHLERHELGPASQDPIATEPNVRLPDYTRWYTTTCRPLLLEFIQTRTSAEVKHLTISSDALAKSLLQRLERTPMADRSNTRMHFLNLYDTTEDEKLLAKSLENFAGTSQPILRSSSRSTSSQSSQNSISSQVSDSDLNDVQQSANMILQALQEGHEELLIVEKGKILSKFGGTKISPLKGEARSLERAMNEAVALLEAKRPNMETIGFLDLGLRLNRDEQRYREMILKPLQSARREDSTLKRLFSRSKGQEESREFLRYLQREDIKLSKSSKQSKRLGDWRDEYPNRIRTMEEITKDVREALTDAEETRDAFLNAGYGIIDKVARLYADHCQLRVQDRFSGDVLVERLFIVR